MKSESRRVLLVGGTPRIVLACCRRAAAAGHRVAVLRWDEDRSEADASRCCEQSLWLGAVACDVTGWRARLSEKLRDGRFTDVWPLDELAHRLLCDGHWRAPAGVRVIGPDAQTFARGADRSAALDAARAAGLAVVPTVHLPRDTPAPPLDLPCVIRPARAAEIEDDEAWRLRTRTLITPHALEHKLRDDLPRVDLLVQPVADGERMELCAAVADGSVDVALAAVWTAGASVPRITPPDATWVDMARPLIERLRWSGLLTLEFHRLDDHLALADVRAGAADWLADADIEPLVVGLLGRVESATRRIVDPWPAFARIAGNAKRWAGKLAIRMRALLWRQHGGVAQARPLRRGDGILVVCKGNINRSMVAEQVLRRHGFERVASAGLLPMSGRRPSRAAERYVEEVLGRGSDALRSSSLRRAMARLETIDLVICFERRHVVELAREHPELRGRIHLLTTMAGAANGPIDIADPHGTDDDTSRRCFERIDALLQRAMLPDAAPVAVPAPAR